MSGKKSPAAVASSLSIDGAGTSDRICVGAVAGAHGVKGAVRIKGFTENPADVAAYGPVSDEEGTRVFELNVIGTAKGGVIARIPEVDDRDTAVRLRGLRLYVPRAVLPPSDEDEFYHADLLGLAAVSADGAALGTVTAVQEAGEIDVLEIAPEDRGPTLMVPFTRDAVPEVDIAGGRIVVVPPEDAPDDDDGMEEGAPDEETGQ